MGRKLGATPRFGKAAEHPIIVVSRGLGVHLPGPPIGAGAAIGRGRAMKSPGSSPGLLETISVDQAAGL